MKALLRFKGHSLVSLVSLVFGFTCFIAATLLANYADSFDQHFPNAQNTYNIMQVATETDAPFDEFPIVNEPAARYLRAAFPELERVVRSATSMPVDVTIDGQTDSFSIRFAEPEFFDIFPVELATGTASASSMPPGTVVITEAAALRRFGTTDVIGTTITLNNQVNLFITDIVLPFENPSHINSDISLFATEMIAPMEAYDTLFSGGTNNELDPTRDRWGNQSYYVYLQFPPDVTVDEAQFNGRLRDFVENTVPPPWGDVMTYELLPVNQLMPTMLALFTAGISIITILQIAGALVLLIGCLNYANLVIAQLSLRSQEIAVQKILGAKRGLLVAQYCWESFLFVALALSVTLLLFVAVLASFPSATVGPGLLLNAGLWTALTAVILVIVLIAGFYPAVRTAMVQLVSMMRPKGSGGYSGKLRAMMVGIQFFISGTLMILAIVMFRQNVAMTDQLDGTVNDPRIAISVPLDTLDINRELLVTQLEQHSSIVSVTQVDRLPWGLGMSTRSLSTDPDLDSDSVEVVTHSVGYDFAQTLDIPQFSGRGFSRDRANDQLPLTSDIQQARGPYAVILDDVAARALGFSSGEEAIGQSIYRQYTPPDVPQEMKVEMNIIGTVGQQKFQFIDYNNFGLSGDMYVLQPNSANFLIIRASIQNVNDALVHIDEIWNNLLPDIPIKRQFADELFYDTYNLFLYMTAAIGTLSILGFLVASVGLLGNATFITNIRQKEVGIRKVMGASSKRLMAMLLFDFAKPVIIANAISWPLGYFIATTYVSLFSARAPVNATPFLISLSLSVLIAVAAVLSQSWKSARVRPAMVLRYE